MASKGYVGDRFPTRQAKKEYKDGKINKNLDFGIKLEMVPDVSNTNFRSLGPY